MEEQKVCSFNTKKNKQDPSLMHEYFESISNDGKWVGGFEAMVMSLIFERDICIASSTKRIISQTQGLNGYLQSNKTTFGFGTHCIKMFTQVTYQETT